MAQKDACRLELRLSRDRILSKMLTVIGKRGMGGVPKILRIPVRTDDSTQLSVRGLGKKDEYVRVKGLKMYINTDYYRWKIKI